MKLIYTQVFILFLLTKGCDNTTTFSSIIADNPKTSERLKEKRYKIFEKTESVQLFEVTKKVIDSTNNVIINDRKLIKSFSENESKKLIELLLNDNTYIESKINHEFIPQYNIDFNSKDGECTILLSVETKRLSFVCNLDGNILFSIDDNKLKELEKILMLNKK